MSTAVGSCQSKVVVSVSSLRVNSRRSNHIWVFTMHIFTVAPVAGPNAGEEEDALPTYKEAFPPLPEKAASTEGTQETVWTSKIRPLKSSIITQVLHLKF